MNRGAPLFRMIVVGLFLGAFVPTARAQNAQLPEESPAAPAGGGSLLGVSPGSLSGNSEAAGADELLPGTAGPRAPRVPQSITEPGRRAVGVPEQDRITAPAILPPGEVPLYGPLSVPSGREEEPPDGLTLDAAIERLIHENLALKARGLELPQADADILTASLRANPLIFADSQLIPYGSYSERRMGGPTQYDINISYPLDVTHKRAARTLVARRARRVLEAQYQDAVRLQIDNLYSSYTDVLAARETIRFAEAAREGLSDLLRRTRGMYKQGIRTIADVSRIESLYEAAEVDLESSEEAHLTAKRNLAVLLNMSFQEAEALQFRGSIRDSAPPPPPVDELIRTALDSRPDLAAFRLGISRAEAEVRLAQANRLSDIYVLYQPYTFQDNSPFNTKSAHSWALGATVPLPLYNRNQGNIRRAVVNVGQSRVELAEREQVVVNEVIRASREYLLTKKSVERIESRLLPPATQARNNAHSLFLKGEEDAFVFLNAQREFNELSRQYRDMLVRHRRSMLRLNTALGVRLLP